MSGFAFTGPLPLPGVLRLAPARNRRTAPAQTGKDAVLQLFGCLRFLPGLNWPLDTTTSTEINPPLQIRRAFSAVGNATGRAVEVSFLVIIGQGIIEGSGVLKLAHIRSKSTPLQPLFP